MIELGAFYSQIEKGISEKGLTLDEALIEARNHSIKWVDVNADYFYTVSPKEFSDRLKKHGMGISSVHGLTVCDVSSNEKIEESVVNMKKQMEFAKEAGSTFFMIVPQSAPTYTEEKREEFTHALRYIFKEVAEYGKQIGIQATVENFSLVSLPYTSFDDIEWLMENIPELMYTYDSGNFYHFGIDKDIMGKKKIACGFDPIMKAIEHDGSVLIYTTKTSIYKKTVFSDFNKYISLCKPINNTEAETLINNIKDYLGATDDKNKDKYSNMLFLLKV